MKIHFFIGLFFSCFANSIVISQGPFKINNDTASLQIEERENDINCPLSIAIYKKEKVSPYELDKICENGDYPNVRSVFFMTLKGVNYIGVIVSWHNKHQAEGIDGTNFEIKVYKKNKYGLYALDEEKTSDPVLSGTEEGTGDGTYKYNNAGAVKKYMKKKYG